MNVKTAYLTQFITVAWGDGTSTSQVSNGYSPVVLTPTHTYAQLGKYTITVNDTDSLGNTVVNSVGVQTAGSEYTAYGPTRLLDTREGAAAAKIQPYSSARVKIAGNGGIPADVTAVVMNVTAADATTSGFITAYGEDTPRPTTSNVNFTAAQPVPNLVIVPVGADGYVDLYNSGLASVDLIADVSGYFTQASAGGYTSLAPFRVADTRNIPGQVAGLTDFGIQIAGNDGGLLPGSGITAVALNVTSTESKSPGFLTVYPDGRGRRTPPTSTTARARRSPTPSSCRWGGRQDRHPQWRGPTDRRRRGCRGVLQRGKQERVPAHRAHAPARHA